VRAGYDRPRRSSFVVVETDTVLRLIEEVAAEVITPRFRALAQGEIHEKNPGDLVTVADHEAEDLLTRALNAAYPDAVVLGEEAYAADPSLMDRYVAAEHAFTVDPVDGTKNFVNGSPDHAVMLSESRAGEVVRAWIHQPQHDLAYVAERGAGSFRNGERLRRHPPSADPDAWYGVTSRRAWVGRSLPGLRPLALTWICCGVDYPKLVEGAADFVLYGAGLPWDHAPGSLLLSEAGAFLGGTDGAAYRPAGPRASGLVAAADEATYDRVLRLL
jgi:fructose-1,6-bisphosphatase/inositol monophosphatase family enzyme